MGNPGFKDHFSGHSARYARARPLYPDALFDHLAAISPARGTAWDCGAGSGQAAQGLASRFQAVIATDASVGQIAKSRPTPGVLFAAAAAEQAPIRDGGIDLIAVGQALHWFDFPACFAEVRRVARPGGVFAAWCYGNCSVTQKIDGVYDRLYSGLVGPYWPPERAHIEDGYASIPIPFPPIPGPAFTMEAHWDLEEFLAYLGTWSAVQYYRKAKGEDPIALIRPEMERAWGGPAETRRIAWPLTLKAGRVESKEARA
ncbi:MAG: class I SAM-dependent methyltransferase [Fibrobacteria bacterium]